MAIRKVWRVLGLALGLAAAFTGAARAEDDMLSGGAEGAMETSGGDVMTGYEGGEVMTGYESGSDMMGGYEGGSDSLVGAYGPSGPVGGYEGESALVGGYEGGSGLVEGYTGSDSLAGGAYGPSGPVEPEFVGEVFDGYLAEAMAPPAEDVGSVEPEIASLEGESSGEVPALDPAELGVEPATEGTGQAAIGLEGLSAISMPVGIDEVEPTGEVLVASAASGPQGAGEALTEEDLTGGIRSDASETITLRDGDRLAWGGPAGKGSGKPAAEKDPLDREIYDRGRRDFDSKDPNASDSPEKLAADDRIAADSTARDARETMIYQARRKGTDSPEYRHARVVALMAKRDQAKLLGNEDVRAAAQKEIDSLRPRVEAEIRKIPTSELMRSEYFGPIMSRKG